MRQRQSWSAGELHVFDTATFTVDGKALESYMADVDTDADYEGDHEAVSGRILP